MSVLRGWTWLRGWRLGLLPFVLSAQMGYVEEGEASYYAASFQGRRTASGEKYDKEALTAAHKTLPFGTYVRVTELSSGRSVIVRINDRGPHKAGRVIDLSERAARELGFLAKGVTAVRLEVTQVPESLPPPAPQANFFDPQGRPIQPKPYAVQIGAFSELQNARTLAQNAQKELKESAFLWRVSLRGQNLYRVLVGGASDRKGAERLRDRLKREGWQSFVVHLPV